MPKSAMPFTLSSSGNPPTYPENGTYADLLCWHLFVWRTRPGGSRTERGVNPWTRSEFCDRIFDTNNTTPESQKKNFRSWTGKADACRPNGSYHTGIKRELFGSNDQFIIWAKDLDLSIERSRTKGKNIRNIDYVKLNIELTELLSAAESVTSNLTIETNHSIGSHAREGASELDDATSQITDALPGLKTNVPRPTKHFVGRQDQIAAIASQLVDPSKGSAILIQGGPGMGKTELTKVVAHTRSVAGRFGDCRYFVALEHCSTASAMRDAIIRALGCDPRNNFEAAVHSLNGKDALIILDNFETPWRVQSEREEIGSTLEYLQNTTRISLLSSYRGMGEAGSIWRRNKIPGLSKEESKDLFISISGDHISGDPHLDKFIYELAGIPLAIALVARRASFRDTLTPLWIEWQKTGINFIKNDTVEEHRLSSLPRSIQLSLDSPHLLEKKGALLLFKILGYLPSGLQSQDRDALIDAEPYVSEERLLQSGLAFEQSGRINLLPPIRDYAQRNFSNEEFDSLKVARHFLSLTKENGNKIGEEGGAEAAARIENDFGNIEWSFTELAKAGHVREAMKAINGFHCLCHYRGIYPSMLEEMADACRDADDKLGVACCFQILGDVALDYKRYDAALRVFSNASSNFKEAGHLAGQAYCIEKRGDVARLRWNHEDARRHYDEALALQREAQDLNSQGRTLSNIGEIFIEQMDLDSAEYIYKDALKIYQEIDSVIGQASCFLTLGRICIEKSRLDVGRTNVEMALTMFRQAGYLSGEASAVHLIGEISRRHSDFENARKSFEQSLQIYERAGSILGEANCREKLAEVAFQCSDHETALLEYERALSIYRQTESKMNQANCLSAIARSMVAKSNMPAAQIALAEALTLYQRLSFAPGIEGCQEKLREFALQG